MGERYFVICLEEDGVLAFATHGYFTTRKAAESYARTFPAAREARVVVATAEFYRRDSVAACGS